MPEKTRFTLDDFGPQPWDKHPREESLWYDRFNMFLQMGSSRSVMKIVRQLDVSNVYFDNVTNHARLWLWRQRAHAWDDHQRKLDAETRKVEREASHRARIDLLNEIKDVYVEKISELLEDPLRWSTASSMLKTIVQELRVEYEGSAANTLDVEIGPIRGDVKESLRVKIQQIQQRINAPGDDEDEEDNSIPLDVPDPVEP